MKMKKIIAAVLSLCIVGGTSDICKDFVKDYSITASAEVISGTCGENLTWTLDDEGTLTISGTGAMENSFPFNDDIKSVIIEDGVTSIGSWTFEECSSLASIIIPDSVTSIGDYAFDGCSGLSSITIPDSVTSIGDSAFWFCTSLESVTIPDSVTSIQDYTFEGCKSLTSIIIPDSVTNIGQEAFSYCTNLTSVIIPDSVTSIGYSAFCDCSGLTSITILNPDCEIYDSDFTIRNGLGYDYDANDASSYYAGIIYGYEGSTAQAYAEQYGYKFEALSDEPTDIAYGDANCDGEVKLNDAVLIMQAISNPNKFGIDGTDELHITEKGWANADCNAPGDGVTGKDALAIQKLTLKLIDSLPEK